MRLVIDTSPWNVITNWDLADAWIFCASWTRAAEAEHFGEYWTNCPKPRGAFFAQYFDGYVSAADQAKAFANILKKYGGVRAGDRLFTDAEVGQLSLTGIIDFIYNLDLQLGSPQGVRYGIYSRKDLLDALSTAKLTTGQKNYLMSLDLWVAGHPYAINPIFPPPAGYLPDQTKYGKPVLYQYATDEDPADWSMFGITSSVDFNTVDEAYFQEWAGANVPVPPPAPLPEPPPMPQPAHVLEIHHDNSNVTESISFNYGEIDLSGVDYVAVDGVHFVAPAPSPDPEPPPTPPPAVDIVHYGILKTQIIRNDLTLAEKYTPAVVQIQDRPVADGHKGAAIPILEAAQKYIRAINNEAGAHYALETVGAMWINTDPRGGIPRGESISCQHNFVSWITEQNGCAKLRCFINDEAFSFDPATVNWSTRPDLFFKAVALNLKGDFNKVGAGIDCFIPLMANHSAGTGELWLALDEIEEFPTLPIKVTVTAERGLRVRKTPVDGEVVSSYPNGEQATILEYRPMGASVWGRTDKGWMCLLLADAPGQREFLTSWWIETPGVIV